MAYSPTDAQVTVSGLGRINGWETMKQQRDENIRMSDGEQGDIGTLQTSEDFSDWQSIGYWYMYSIFLSLASTSSDMWSIDVSGVETAWGSRRKLITPAFPIEYVNSIFSRLSSNPQSPLLLSIY